MDFKWRDLFRAHPLVCQSDLHLGELQRVVVTVPLIPFDAVSVGRMRPPQVCPVQVRLVTTVVPPRSFVLHSTTTVCTIINIPIERAELHSVLICHRVSWIHGTNQSVNILMNRILRIWTSDFNAWEIPPVHGQVQLELPWACPVTSVPTF